MDVAKKYEQIKKLRALADGAGTDAEAENARARIDEIEAKIRLEHERRGSSKGKRVGRLRVTLSGKVSRFETEWPFGWTRSGSVEVSEVGFSSDNKIVLEWKCPSCGVHIERVITPRHRARLMVKPNGVRGFIDDIRGGKLNQLCDECWEKHK